MKLNPANWRKIFLPVFVALVFFGCRKDDGLTNDVPIIHPDFVTKVTAGNVSGFVTNENNDPVQGATVKIGGSTIITDEYGFFEANNVLVVKQAATVTVTQAGYFNGIKTFLAEEGRDAFFRIKLLPKTIAGTIDAAAGGQINTTAGVKITFPTAAIVNAATNAAYTGSVHVAATWIDPSSPELNSIMPGDLRGIDANNGMKLLTTYGMVAVEMRGNSGELLQIAPGKKAGLTFPIPSSILSSASASIPLWSFDEEKGLWIEEGSAVKTGNTYVGEVGHFSFWNCDLPNNWVQFNVTLHDAAGQALPNIRVKLSLVNNPIRAAQGITDQNGYVAGAVFPNEQIKMEVMNSCFTTSYTEIFTTTNINMSLGTIKINPPTQIIAQISGTATNCNDQPITDGFVMMHSGTGDYHYIPVYNGTFNINYILCNGIQAVSFVVEDKSTGQQNSVPITFSLSGGNNIIPPIQACGLTTQQYYYTVYDGTSVNFTFPDDTMECSRVQSEFQVMGYRNGANFRRSLLWFPQQGVGVGTTVPLLVYDIYFPSGIQVNSLVTGIDVNITEFGLVGQFISGNYAGTFVTNTTPSTTHTISGSFRVRRVN